MTNDRMFERRTILRGGALVVLAMPLAAKAALAEDKMVALRNADAQAALRLLEHHPYTSVGSGMPVYAFVSARCPYCQAMYRKYPDAVPGVEMRYIAEPIVEEESGEVIKVWQARTPAVFNAYMQHRLVGTPRVADAPPSEYRRGPMPPPPSKLSAFYGFWLDNMTEVTTRFEAAYPNRSIGATPCFFIPAGDTLYYLSGVESINVVIAFARWMKNH